MALRFPDQGNVEQVLLSIYRDSVLWFHCVIFFKKAKETPFKGFRDVRGEISAAVRLFRIPALYLL